MLAVRLVAAALLALAFAGPAPAAAPGRAEPAPAPTGLKPFLLRSSEPAVHTFPRTPSFAWAPVRGAMRYEFELSKKSTFDESGIFWSDTALKTPAVSIPLALPWLTGTPYAVYAHVRAVTPTGVSAWSAPYGFNIRWQTIPTSIPTLPGLVRWTPVDGATSYQVWFVDIGKVVETKTTVADEREYYTFHQTSPWPDVVRWRARAVRRLFGSIPNGLPAVKYGPWSRGATAPWFTSTNPPFQVGPLTVTRAISDTASTPAKATAHRLTPGFAFSGNQALDASPSGLYRVYVFSDHDCVNTVFRGAVVGSPAYAPRSTGPLNLPRDTTALSVAATGYLRDGSEGTNYMADTSRVSPTESDSAPATAAPGDSSTGGSSGDSGSSGTSSPSTGDSGTAPASPAASDPASTETPDNLSLPSTPVPTGAPIDLWDSGWPNGRFYWTVVPVNALILPGSTTTLSASAAVGATSVTVADASALGAGATITIGSGATKETASIMDVAGAVVTLEDPLQLAHSSGESLVSLSTTVEYHDAELPQDACAAGRIGSFGKASQPVVTATSAPYISGLTPAGRLIAAAGARPAFYGSPLVAWQPALGADEYQLQWSRTRYPWKPVDPKTGAKYERLTFATSALLPLAPGTWYYRVRGLDFSLPGTARAMSWSNPVVIVVAKPVFEIVGAPKRSSPAAPKG